MTRVGYWVATVLVTAELVLGGCWDALLVPQVRGVVTLLGYPAYFLVMLGIAKLLAAVALLVPRFPRLKEWAYAGVVFVDIGAIVSHLSTGVAIGEIAYLILLLVLTAVSWLLRPPSRRVAEHDCYRCA